MDKSGLLIIFANHLVASETVEPQVTLAVFSRLHLSPTEQSQAETLAGVGAFDRKLVDVPGIRWYIAPKLLVTPLESNRPNSFFPE